MNWKCPACGNEENTDDALRCICGNVVTENNRYIVADKGGQSSKKPISKTQFIAALLSATIACALLLTHTGFGRAFFMVFLGLSSIIMTSREDRSKPLKSKDFIAIGLFIALIIGMSLWFQENWDKQIRKWFSHPLFVLPFWVLILLLTYRRWRISQRFSKDKSA